MSELCFGASEMKWFGRQGATPREGLQGTGSKGWEPFAGMQKAKTMRGAAAGQAAEVSAPLS